LIFNIDGVANAEHATRFDLSGDVIDYINASMLPGTRCQDHEQFHLHFFVLAKTMPRVRPGWGHLHARLRHKSTCQYYSGPCAATASSGRDVGGTVNPSSYLEVGCKIYFRPLLETKDCKAAILPLVSTRLRILISCNFPKKIWRDMCNRTMDEDWDAKVPCGLARMVAVRLPPRSLMLGSPCDAPTVLSAYSTVTAWGVVAVRRQT
jgi:hypothetical protein